MLLLILLPPPLVLHLDANGGCRSADPSNPGPVSPLASPSGVIHTMRTEEEPEHWICQKSGCVRYPWQSANRPKATQRSDLVILSCGD